MTGLKVGNQQVRIVGMKVLPGHEKDVLEYLEGADPLGHYFKGLGGHDLVHISDSPGQDILWQLKVSPHTVGHNSMTCFPWNGSADLGAIARAKVVGICRLKLDDRVSEALGVEADSLADEAIRRASEGLSGIGGVVVLGSLGWPELVALVPCYTDEWDSLLTVVLGILGLSAGDLKSDVLEGLAQRPLFAWSSTVVAIPYARLTEQEPPAYPEVAEKLEAAGGKGFAVRVSVGCRSDSIAVVVAKIMELFHCTPEIQLGDYDVTFTTDMPPHELARRLLRLRLELRDSILSTMTTVARTALQEEASPRTSIDETSAVDLEEVLTEVVPAVQRSGNQDLANGLLSAVTAYNRAVADSFRRRGMYGVSQYLKALLTSSAQDLGLSTDMEDAALGEMLDVFMVGLDQRLGNIGEESVDSFTSGYGPRGMSRVLEGCDRLLALLTESASVTWTGFSLFNGSRYQEGYLGDVSLPADAFLSPEEWWGAFHEVGHYVAFKKRIEEDPRVLQALDLLGATTNLSPHSSHQAKMQFRFMTELYADLFDYHHGFHRQQDLYLSALWKYFWELYDRSPESVMSHLVRTSFVLLSERNPDERHAVYRSDDECRAHLEHTMGAVCEHSPWSPERLVSNGDVTPLVSYLVNWAPVYEAILAAQTFSEELSESFVERLRLGEIPNHVLRPEGLILDLMRISQADGTVPFRSKVAAILALWHSSRLEPVPVPVRAIMPVTAGPTTPNGIGMSVRET